MNETNKSQFIAETAAKILVAMYKRPDKDPDEKIAVISAAKLWNQLEKQKFVPSSD
jgi:hypothetical protein